MGNGYDHHSLHHHHHYFHRKTIFLPIFCRLSIKDIKLYKSQPSAAAADEPSSPKVSCMGQVKRNNRVIGFPSTAATTTASAAAAATHHHKYSKLKKLFSSKSLLPPTTTSLPTTAHGSAAVRSGSKSCRSSKEMCVNNLRRLKSKNDGDKWGQDCVKLVNVKELDPPLPVVKRVAPQGVGRDEVNIWKRRINGVALKGLQIEQIHLPNCNSQPPTV
ncbi:hypothetical protein BUALT_Bualt01G0009100 [Buddleja alternifolia]|uniref:Uncharacterized protein n=1 Tax=Buddleja alternifolia TaxID=168488 RepID=A0AAV6YEG1_9LAMI|nr:hypothetical protein BUALT_Bualt01G0009100 [Buddleja alternifolia]